MKNTHAQEIASGDRFAFGENWTHFLNVLNDTRIMSAQESLANMLGTQTLEGKRFIDVGSGSGLFSLVARRMGATVHSFDFDPKSVACTAELKRRYYENDNQWHVETASALDGEYMSSLGTFDVVYSWGVLHHTGEMWKGVELASNLVAANGLFFLALYNDQGGQSTRWLQLKRWYNRLPRSLRPIYAGAVMGVRELKFLCIDTIRLKPQQYFISRFRGYGESARGMSYWHDLIDWIGGYPFEVAKVEEVFDFMNGKGFVLEKLTTAGGGPACNEWVFRKVQQSP